MLNEHNKSSRPYMEKSTVDFFRIVLRGMFWLRYRCGKKCCLCISHSSVSLNECALLRKKFRLHWFCFWVIVTASNHLNLKQNQRHTIIRRNAGSRVCECENLNSENIFWIWFTFIVHSFTTCVFIAYCNFIPIIQTKCVYICLEFICSWFTFAWRFRLHACQIRTWKDFKFCSQLFQIVSGINVSKYLK